MPALADRVLLEILDVLRQRRPLGIARPVDLARHHVGTVAHPEQKRAFGSVRVLAHLARRVDNEPARLILTQGRDLDGNLTWFPALDGALVEEAEADAYLERTASRDPDVWIVEIEHRDGWHPFQDGLH